jgi:hypothetical protein
MDRIQVVHFKAFAPYGCCRAAHEILKGSPSIRTIIFENYSFFIPAQFKMEALTKVKQPVSILFFQCQLPPGIATAVIAELCKFPGEFQRLNFGGFQLNSSACKEIFSAIENARSFRTVEMIGFDDVNAKSVSPRTIVAAIGSILTRCRFLQNVSFGNWSPPLNLQPSLFANSNVLHEVHLNKQDMSQTVVDFTMPRHLHLIEFSQCNFTSASFARLFEVLSRATTPLVLILADLQIPNPHWRVIFSSLNGYPILRCLRELDWSGNQIPTQSIDQFVNYFFQSNPIRFLSLDRLYRRNTNTDMSLLFNKLPQGQLWGISVCGNKEWNFSGSMQDLLETISSLRDLRILHLDGQRFTDSDVEPLLDFLRGHQNRLVEFSCDGSALSTPERFYSFYQEIDRLNLFAVGRPHNDLVRLFQRPQPVMPQQFETFRSLIQKRNVATSQSIRAFYMCRQNPGGNFEPEEIYAFSNTYPRYATIDRQDIWFLYPKSSGAEIPSLCTLIVPGPFEGLAKTHVQLLMDPMALPRFPPAPEIAVIDSFAEESDQLAGTVFPGANLDNRGDDDIMKITMTWFPGRPAVPIAVQEPAVNAFQFSMPVIQRPAMNLEFNFPAPIFSPTPPEENVIRSSLSAVQLPNDDDFSQPQASYGYEPYGEFSRENIIFAAPIDPPPPPEDEQDQSQAFRHDIAPLNAFNSGGQIVIAPTLPPPPPDDDEDQVSTAIQLPPVPLFQIADDVPHMEEEEEPPPPPPPPVKEEPPPPPVKEEPPPPPPPVKNKKSSRSKKDKSARAKKPPPPVKEEKLEVIAPPPLPVKEEPPPVSKKSWVLQRAAGLLKLPKIHFGHKPRKQAGRQFRFGDKIEEIPLHTEIGKSDEIRSREALKVSVTVDDVSNFTKALTKKDLRVVNVVSSLVLPEIDVFYEDQLPFQPKVPRGVPRLKKMTHPLSGFKRLPKVVVELLTPSDW